MELRIRKGLNIRLMGTIQDASPIDIEPSVCGIVPTDYPGFMPKVDVGEGDRVSVGSKILHDKKYPEICLTSPVSGVVKAVVRGERRRILRVEIENDRRYNQADELRSAARDADTLKLLCRSGLFAEMRRRPFDTVARPDIRPRDIFITALDTAPLAFPLGSRLGSPEQAMAAISRAVSALRPLTDGLVYLAVGDDWTLGDIPGAEMVHVSGPHPAGNVGIQIANIRPVNKGEEVWTLDIITLRRIGRLLADGVLDTTVMVALTGHEVDRPCVIRTYEGAEIASLVGGRLKDNGHNIRIISGNVLTGTAVDPDDFLRFPFRQITAIDEGNDVDELLGWASIAPSKLSVSAAYPLSRLRRAFAPDARLGGSPRAMILSGIYDKMLPADILLEFLIKAILSQNIDHMEALGIYEIAPEDVALCEFVDPSKLPLQQIVRRGLDLMIKEV